MRAVRVKKAEAAIREKGIDDDVIRDASEGVREVDFSDDSKASGAYRKATCEELFRRTLGSAAKRAGAGNG